MLRSINRVEKCKYIRNLSQIALNKKQNQDVNKNTHASNTSISKECKASNNVKKYDEIPGPKGIFGIGTFYHYFPVFGKYSWDEVHKSGMEKYAKYGEIVKETMIPGIDVVWLFDPNDVSKVLNNSGPDMYPQRKSHLGLEKYRKDRPHIYKTGGLLPTNGSEWWRLRSEFQKGLSSPNHIRQFLADADNITKEFVSLLKPSPANEAKVADILPELSRLNLELVCYLAFDVRMESFTEKERAADSRSNLLIQAAEDSNSCLLPLDQGLPIWRYIETPVYRKFRTSQEYIESVALDLVTQKVSFLSDQDGMKGAQTNHRRSLLDDYLQNPKLDLADVVGMACDLLLAGVDTTTYSTCFLLYHIARNPHIQEKLFCDALSVLPDFEANEITADKMSNQLSYSKAVLKETFRLNPVSVGVGRTTNTDLVLSGYNVPKGTITVTQNFISCRLANHFESPDKFIPERWLKSSTIQQRKINPYLVLPFGHGMRSCIARRFAEQNMLVLMLRIIRKFEIGWAGVNYLGIKTTTTINKPEHPVKITLKKRRA